MASNAAASPVYLGIDPGLNRTGYAILAPNGGNPALREGGVIRTRKEDSLAMRVLEIGRGVREVIEEFRPRMLAIEQVFSFGKNPKTALLLAHARGAILFVAAELQVPVIHFTPTQIKKLLTGSGKASKEQVQHAIRHELHLDDVLEPNDVADAAAIALCMFHTVRFAA
ncbi:MAG: crossover junction endodeoxyribonuclease RuvC [Planctomycetota bacterium]|nr:crossover junction endodeoxyribonuclease RuvC [Planctomycetota bacterium]